VDEPGELSSSTHFPKKPTENELSDFSQLSCDGCGEQSMGHNVWTKITRPKYERAGQRYAGDLTDAEWALIEPYMPAVKPLGRPRETDLRAVLDAILYIARTGCQWRMLPKDFPPFITVQGHFMIGETVVYSNKSILNYCYKRSKRPIGRRAPRPA
jgi:Putative transposase of IS4/5 family (DUF4096)